MNDFLFFASDSCRSRAYIDLMLSSGLRPSMVFLINIASVAEKSDQTYEHTELFCNTIPLSEQLDQYRIPYKTFNIDKLNNENLLLSLKDAPQNHVIFSIAGRILRKEFFNFNKKYIHVHPGRLPYFRGSTPMYYTMLKEESLVASAIFLEKEIDTGPLIAECAYPIPHDVSIIDTVYDPWMRADLLVKILLEYNINGKFSTLPQSNDQGETYYVIHPVLKCLAIKKAQKTINPLI